MLRRGVRAGCRPVVLAILLASPARDAWPASPPPDQAEFFETRVRPVLVESCGKCHGSAKQASGLRLDSREALLEGGENGPAVVAGDPDKSLLIQAVRQTHEDVKMPPKGKLPAAAVEALAEWVKMGAPWPAVVAAKAVAGAPSTGPETTHWAFRPVKPVVPPAVKDRGWVGTPVDAFVLARLETEGLTPSPAADRRTLIRRVSFDLTGLPPTPEEVEAFVDDRAADAFGRLVERLLASTRYGERWGRHWLDVARYADTKGYVFNEERKYPYAYTYRDYVIRAFNEDKPYDAFLTEQLAADRLGPGKDPASLAALGFLTVGRRFLNVKEDIIDDRIDVVTRGLLGLSVACARCHDHKFDPIPTDDYYSLYGVFASSVEPADPPEIPAAVPEALGRDFREKLAVKQTELNAFTAARLSEIRADLRGHAAAYLRAALDLKFDRRSAKLDDRAKADKLAPGPLRRVVVGWKEALDASRAALDPLFAPWLAFAALTEAEFAGKAAMVAKTLVDDPKKANPVLAQAFVDHPPATMAEVATRYGDTISEAERRWQAASKAGAKALPEPGWEAVRQLIHGEKGPLNVTAATLPRALDRVERNKLKALGNEIARFKATHPGSPPRAMVLNDAPSPVEPHVFLRGNPGRPGKQVPRRFLAVLSGPDRAPFRDGSGRLELARAIASPDNPLTARVMVNRVWAHHFGAGLVATPSDFGRRSDPPTHPELLDWLADDFARNGWSVKSLHRRIVLSNTYRQQSASRPDLLARDPENRLYGRFNRRRLDFEAMRDALLSASGALDPAVGGRGGPLAEPPFSTRRTVYGFVDRQNLDPVYRTFDFASPDSSSPRRVSTTVPQQALFLMNSPFTIEQAKRLARSPGLGEGPPEARVRWLYGRLFGREPGADEQALGVEFVDRKVVTGSAGAGLTPWEEYAQVLLMTNEFSFVD